MKNQEKYSNTCPTCASEHYFPTRRAANTAFAEWERTMRRQASALLGAKRSKAKSAASKANGAKGGRPRKLDTFNTRALQATLLINRRVRHEEPKPRAEVLRIFDGMTQEQKQYAISYAERMFGLKPVSDQKQETHFQHVGGVKRKR